MYAVLSDHSTRYVYFSAVLIVVISRSQQIRELHVCGVWQNVVFIHATNDSAYASVPIKRLRVALQRVRLNFPNISPPQVFVKQQ